MKLLKKKNVYTIQHMYDLCNHLTRKIQLLSPQHIQFRKNWLKKCITNTQVLSYCFFSTKKEKKKKKKKFLVIELQIIFGNKSRFLVNICIEN